MAILGASLIVVAIGGTVAAWAAGSAYGLLQAPPHLVVEVTPTGSFLPSSSYWYGQVSGWAYLSQDQEYVASVDSDESGTGFVLGWGHGGAASPEDKAVCPGAINEIMYPGFGPIVYTQCFYAGHQSALLGLNASSFAPLGAGSNVSLGTWSPIVAYAFNPAGSVLFATTLADQLFIVNLSENHLVAAPSLPGYGLGGAGVLYDPQDGRLLASDPGNNSLLLLDPTSGAIASTIAMPGVVTLIAASASGQILYVAGWSGANGTIGWVSVLNATTLASEKVFQTGPQIMGAAFPDPRAGEMILSNGVGVVVINVSTQALVDSTGTLFPQTESIAFDPATATFAVAPEIFNDFGCPFSCAESYDVSQNYTSEPSFSAVPVVGANTPWVVGAIGLIAGTGLLIARRVQYPPHWDLAERGESVRPQDGTDAEQAEAARQRWLAEEQRRPPPRG